MLEIANFIASNPQSAVSFLAVILACFMGFLLYRQWEKRSSQMEESFQVTETKFEIRSNSLEKAFSETRAEIHAHREDMGKATKAISGDMLKVKEKIFEMKSELADQVEDLRKFSSEIHRSMILAQETAKIAIDNLNEKLGRVIVIENKMQTFESYLTKLQESNGETKTELLKHRGWFGELAKSLKDQKSKLEALERESKGAK